MTHSQAEHSGIKRLYYSISEVSQLVDEEQYVLRYWETEFEQLRPQKNRAGNRIYTDKELDLLRTIKHLLREKRFTIDGAKEHLRSLYAAPTSEAVSQTTTNGITSNGAVNLASEEISAKEISKETPKEAGAVSGDTASETLVQFEKQIPPAISKYALSREELAYFRDTLRELLNIIEQK
jgi:DNA-binding transcriptional MerR regulator